MNPFTDEDLKFWRELGGDNELEENLEIAPTTLKALLARLEAAEALIADYPQYEPEMEEKRQAWREAAGK